MRRRTLISSLVSGAFVSTTASAHQSNAAKFKLAYGPHPGMFKNSAGEDMLDQIRFAADQGFTAWEDNSAMGYEPAKQTQVGELLAKLNMQMGVFVSHADFRTSNFVTKTDKEFQDSMRAIARKAVDSAKRLNAKWNTVVPSTVNPRLDPGYQEANCITNLKVMTEIMEPAGVTIVLEPLNWYRDHPSLFLRGVPQTYAICKGVNSKSCKILDDLYHQQIDIGNLIPNMQMAWDEIAYIQTGDNPGRKEPTTGEINYKNIFKWLYEKKYTGVIGMEHGNSKPGKEGELAVIQAYRECDSY